MGVVTGGTITGGRVRFDTRGMMEGDFVGKNSDFGISVDAAKRPCRV